MKKNKIIPIISIAALGTSIVPLVTMVSCNNNKVTDLKAEYTLKTSIYAGTSIKKTDILVKATYSNGEVKEVKDWTCDLFNTYGKYSVTLVDEFNTEVNFVIKFGGKETTLTLKVTPLTACTFGIDTYTLYQQGTISSLKQIHLFATGGWGFPQLDVSLFGFNFFPKETPTTATDDVGVSYLKESDVYVVKVKTGSTVTEGTLTAYLKQDPDKNALASVTVQIVNNGLSFQTSTDHTASIILGNNLPESLAIPEFIQDGEEYYVVTYMGGDHDKAKGVRYLYLPRTLTGIKDHLFDFDSAEEKKGLEEIVYLGTSEEWWLIDTPTNGNWQGNLAIGAYCFGDSKYVKFNNRLNSVHVSQCEEIGGYSAIAAEEKFGSTSSQQYVIRFDYGTLSVDFKQYVYIDVKNSATGYQDTFRINNVYLNGRVLAADADNDYTIETEVRHRGFLLKLTQKTIDKLNEHSLITLNISTPMDSEGTIW